MNHPAVADAQDATSLMVSLLDMGNRKYGDCILCRYQDQTILVDGGHSADRDPSPGVASIPEQLAGRLHHDPPFHVTLLVVTHCHSDHIGCLPWLVEDGTVTADWALVADERFGWGRTVNGDAPIDAPDIEGDRRLLLAALREDSRRDLPDEELIEFIQDAQGQEERYKRMLATLEANGTQVVRFGRDDHALLEESLSPMGLQILGPTQDHLIACANKIHEYGRDSADAVRHLPATDAEEESVLETYRWLASPPGTDASVFQDSWGASAMINRQSIVFALEVDNRKVLLTGDMQLAETDVDGLEDHMQALVDAVVGYGPYDFVKLPHHSSHNGMSEELYEALVPTRRYGHQGGKGSSHPSTEVLEMLEEQDGIKWCRTDLNGLITVRLSEGGVWIFKDHGDLNDFTPPGSHDRPETGSTAPPAGSPRVSYRRRGAHSDVVEVITRIPHRRTRVHVTIDIDPPAASTDTGRDQDEAQPLDLNVGFGRELPRLMFVTSRSALSKNIGEDYARVILDALQRTEHAVVDTLAGGTEPAAHAAEAVYRAVTECEQAGRPVQGIVLLGGYDVIRPLRLQILDPDLQALQGRLDDHDRFLVWSDEIYGDVYRDDRQDLPVSRIPDGHSAELVLRALEADAPRAFAKRFGVRNVMRPFADEVWRGLPGTAPLFSSEPSTARSLSPVATRSDLTYFMLHGAWWDATTFTGESGPAGPDPVAVTLDTVPEEFTGAVLTGCCWGALAAKRPAVRVDADEVAVGRTADDSIALRYLWAGAHAFVGCTGTHYSPTTPPYGYFGQPMHEAFWQRYLGRTPPAVALFEAKQEYLRGIPHYYNDDPVADAIEQKILRQFTCLGLGW